MSVQILVGDCVERMRELAPATVDAIVTDPPYHLTQASRNGSARNPGTGPFGRHRVGEKGFMGKTWDGDGVAFRPETWAAALEVAKPGAYMLAFGGTRTHAGLRETQAATRWSRDLLADLIVPRHRRSA
jgi:DNA modification methylase